MASLPIRDPVGDPLLTPQNSALVVIDYQPSQFAGVRSIDRDLLLENIVSTVETAKGLDMKDYSLRALPQLRSPSRASRREAGWQWPRSSPYGKPACPCHPVGT